MTAGGTGTGRDLAPGGARGTGRDLVPGAAAPGTRRSWLAEVAWSPGLGLRERVLLESEDGRFTRVTPEAAQPPPEAVGLAGLTLPGFANAHSHAFHRALRGVAEGARGTFWTWRDHMYEVAQRLDPDSYLALARAVYAEMTLAGVTCVGEFHYLHHAPGGVPYADPNEMGRALIRAAAEAGLRITLLDTCYLAGGLGEGGDRLPLLGPQQRFSDGDSLRWAERAEGLLAGPGPGFLVGAAIHSVRAVPPGQMPEVIAWARRHGAPLHAHLSEQRAENAACLAAYGATPAEVLDGAGALGQRTTVVHATHLTERDIGLAGDSGCYACFCPTTEADLADGIGPARKLASAGSRLTLGSDSQAVIDLLEEARRVELGERLASQRRGHFTAAELATAATAAGQASLGWPEAGQFAPGALADLVTVTLDSPRTAGAQRQTALESVVFGATAADVLHVVIGGTDVVRDGRHLLVEDVPAALRRAVGGLLG